MFKRLPAGGILGEHALREAQEYRKTIDAVRAAIDMAVRATTPNYSGYTCVVAAFDDRLIAEINEKTWSYPYTITETYDVTLGTPSQVVMEWRAVKMTEAVASDALLEATKGADGKSTGKYKIIAIRAGLSGNGNFYSDATLREAVSLFENARVFVKSDAEHLAGGGKDVRNLIGQLTGAAFVEGKATDTGYITATLELIDPADAIGTKLREAYARGMQGLFGFSIDAVGKTASVMREGKRVRVATKFTKVNSVDLIVEPGAGGALVRMVEAADSEEKSDMSIKQRMLEAIKKWLPAKAAVINLETVSDDVLDATYREALAAETADAADAAKKKADEAKLREAAGSGHAVLTADEVEARIAQANARSHARVAIGASKLPKKTQERLQKQFDGMDRFTEAQVDSAIKEAREEIGSFIESGRVSMGGFDDIVVEDRAEKMKDMLDAFFDPAHKNHRSVTSFKEAYAEMTGDRRVTGDLRNCDMRRLTEGIGAFRESIASTTFANALGDSITRRMQAVFTGLTELQAWRKVAVSTPVNDFRSQERVRIGGYGNLPAVTQGSAYAALTSPSDEKATYSVSKRGGTEDVTLEAIRNDDVGAIRRIPAELALAAANTLYEFVFDFYRTNPTIYDAAALYVAGHNNLFVTGLSAAEFATHRVAMAKQARAGSAKRLGLTPRTILVPWELQETAYNLFVRNQNLDKTFVQSINPEVIVPAYWTDANDWVTVCDPQVLPVIEVGFLDGREEPELFVQDMPNVGSLFSNDKLTYKIRHIYSGNVLVDGFKGTTKAVVP